MRTSLLGMALLGVVLAGGGIAAQHHGSASQHKASTDQQFLLHLGLFLVEDQLNGVAANDVDLHLVAAAGLLVGRYIIEIVGHG